MDGDKVYGLCSLCGGALLSDHDCIGLRKAFGLPTSVDWQAVARDAAVAYMAAIRADTDSTGSFNEWADESCDAALALVAEMQKREGFGGQT